MKLSSSLLTVTACTEPGLQPPESFSGKNSANILHGGSVSVSLGDAYVVSCIWLFVPEMSFLKAICFGIS